MAQQKKAACQPNLYPSSTLGVGASLKTTIIAYDLDPSKMAKLRWYAIAAHFKNALTLLGYQGWFVNASNNWP